MGHPAQSVGAGRANDAAVAGSRGKGLIAQLASLLAALSASRYRNRLALLAAGIVVVICANSVGQIWLNVWQGSFFDALEQRDLATFGGQLLVFCLIVGALLVLVVAQTWLKEMLRACATGAVTPSANSEGSGQPRHECRSTEAGSLRQSPQGMWRTGPGEHVDESTRDLRVAQQGQSFQP
jgi:putative ATP-binding cassette transporter